MIDRWYYTHGGQTLGPVSAAQLRQMAADGRLEPADLIWPEGRDRGEAVPAQAAVAFGAPAPPPAHAPDWLDDIRAAEATGHPPAKKAAPDWVEDVRSAEEDEQDFLPLEWDADVPEAADEPPVDDVEEVADAEAVTQVLPAPEAAPCRLVVGCSTTRGRVRERNEDSFLVQQSAWGGRGGSHDVALLVVADGMGGHQAGDRASALVVRGLAGVLPPLVGAALGDESAVPSPRALAEALDRGLLEANRLVLQASNADAACKGMGSTAVAVLVWDGHAAVSLVGDCRVYHWRAGRLEQVTRDQTLVARMVELGQLSPQEAARHPRRNEVTQAVGRHGRIEPARYQLTLEPGDWLIACCDGLYAHVTDAMLAEAIAAAGESAAGLADRLIELANAGGGSDNCTVLAARCL